MKLYIFITSLIFTLFAGCGSNSTSSDSVEQERILQKEQPSIQEHTDNRDQAQKADEEEDDYVYHEGDEYKQNNTQEEEDEKDYTHDKNSVIISDSSISYAPNIILHDGTPEGAYYEYIQDPQKGYVISLHTNGIKNSFHILGYDVTRKYIWEELPNYQHKFNLSWDSKFSEDFIIFVVVVFSDGDGNKIYKDLVYTPSEHGYPNYTNSFMHISLGEDAKDGSWHHFSRNVLSDVRRFYPHADIADGGYINGFAVRGTGKITNIRFWE